MTSRTKACQHLWMTRRDVNDFSRALHAAHPNLVFVASDYWRSIARAEERRGTPSAPGSLDGVGNELESAFREPDGRVLPTWGSLAVPEESTFLGWLLPPDWAPQWSAPNAQGERTVENRPRLRFYFDRRRFTRAREPGFFDEPPKSYDDDEALYLEPCSFSLGYSRYDDEAEAIARGMFRILAKMTIDRFVVVDRKSYRARSLVPERNRRYGMAGREAVTWAMERRHNYFDAGLLYKPADYPFATNDVFTADELAADKARSSAELEARIQRMTEETKASRREWLAERRKERMAAKANAKRPT